MRGRQSGSLEVGHDASCVAVAIVTYLKANPEITNKTNAKMRVRTTGKEILDVTFDLIDGNVTNVWLKGSAKFIAKGEYYV